MSKASVIDQNKTILEPCHPAVARRLLRGGQAAVFKRYPFTIILKREVVDVKTTNYTLSIDPGSKCTGMAITDSENNIVACFELHHRGNAIKKNLQAKQVIGVAVVPASVVIVQHVGRTAPVKHRC